MFSLLSSSRCCCCCCSCGGGGGGGWTPLSGGRVLARVGRMPLSKLFAPPWKKQKRQPILLLLVVVTVHLLLRFLLLHHRAILSLSPLGCRARGHPFPSPTTAPTFCRPRGGCGGSFLWHPSSRPCRARRSGELFFAVASRNGKGGGRKKGRWTTMRKGAVPRPLHHRRISG